MKKFQSLLIGLLVFSSLHQASGQQVYNANDYGGPGTIYLYNDLFGFQQDTILTRSGTDVTWDLSSFTNIRTHPEKIVAKEAAFDFFTFLTICALGGHNALDCANIWNNTDQAWLVTDTVSLFQFSLTDLQRYQTISNSSLLENFLGFNAHLGTMNVAAVVVYQNPDTILHFPVVYGDHFTSSTAWTIDLAPAGQNVKYTSHQQRETSIDAWGDILTPNQTFNNVVRMRSLVHRQDTLVTDTMTVPLNLTQVE
ncbi:MAG TPA: hypothetical protein VJ508_15910, partial [Saprospiraceae bacterium]|nr:hypothetical protein [Saprospiraceae bacterium]